jgi:hypothetical protein
MRTMRLWSLHPRYLDSRGLVALWREGLLAQKVLQGRTKGYRHHPQLSRFINSDAPLSAIGVYLFYVAEEASSRKYQFNTDKILFPNLNDCPIISVTRGQLNFETTHLLKKLKIRDLQVYRQVVTQSRLRPHPIFRSVAGPTEEWEVQ